MPFDENANPILDHQNLLSRLDILPADDNDRPLPASPESYVSSDATDPDPDIVLRPRPRPTDWTAVHEAQERWTEYCKQHNEGWKRLAQLAEQMEKPKNPFLRQETTISPPKFLYQQVSARIERNLPDENDQVPLFLSWGHSEQEMEAFRKENAEALEMWNAEKSPEILDPLERMARLANEFILPGRTFRTQTSQTWSREVRNKEEPPFTSVAERCGDSPLVQPSEDQGPGKQTPDPTESVVRPLRRSPRIAKMQQRKEIAGPIQQSTTTKQSPCGVKRSRGRTAKAGEAEQRSQKNAGRVQPSRAARCLQGDAKQPSGRPARTRQTARDVPSNRTNKEPSSRPTKRHKK